MLTILTCPPHILTFKNANRSKGGVTFTNHMALTRIACGTQDDGVPSVKRLRKVFVHSHMVFHDAHGEEGATVFVGSTRRGESGGAVGASTALPAQCPPPPPVGSAPKLTVLNLGPSAAGLSSQVPILPSNALAAAMAASSAAASARGVARVRARAEPPALPAAVASRQSRGPSLSNGAGGDMFERLQKHQASRLLREQQAVREQHLQNMHAQQYAYNSLSAAAAMATSRGLYGSMAQSMYGNPQMQQARAFFMATHDQQQQLGQKQQQQLERWETLGLGGSQPRHGGGGGAARAPSIIPGAVRSIHRSPEEAEQALRDLQRALLSGTGA